MANWSWIRRDIFQRLQNVPEDQKFDFLFKNCVDNLPYKITPEIETDVRGRIHSFLYEIRKRWKEARYIINRFETVNAKWLNGELKTPAVSADLSKPAAKRPGGRPKSNIESLTLSAKRKRVAETREKYSASELLLAAEMNLRASGDKQRAEAVKQAAATGATLPQPKPEPIPFSADEALALFDQAHLTKEQYNVLRKKLIEHKVQVLPSYERIQGAKEACYPDDILVYDVAASISVQSLADHTMQRLAIVISDVLTNLPEVVEVNLIWKWGFDGSSSHLEYKQVSAEDVDYSSILLTAAVPLQLHALRNDGKTILLWHNIRPQSTKTCRPLGLEFQKETKDVVRNKSESINEEIKELNPTDIKAGERIIQVKHKMYQTMLDGKVKGYITETSCQSCEVCGVTPKFLNAIDDNLERPITASVLKYGLSILHGWIWSYEMFLHISYRNVEGVQISNQRYTETQKGLMKTQEASVKKKLREVLGLKADEPKAGGKGNCNDGNSARRFFENPKKTAEITGLDEELLERFRVILVTLSCGYTIDPVAYKEYAVQTARQYKDLYGWYWMPVSVHRILTHGADFIRAAPLPIGMMAEDAIESRHKDMRYLLLHNTRKTNRTDGNTDLLHSLLISSDPVINSFKQPPKHKLKKIDKAVIGLLADPLACEYDESLIDLLYESDDD